MWMRWVCKGASVQDEQSSEMPTSESCELNCSMALVCVGTLVHYEQTVREPTSESCELNCSMALVCAAFCASAQGQPRHQPCCRPSFIGLKGIL
jgi:hypothetical protein